MYNMKKIVPVLIEQTNKRGYENVLPTKILKGEIQRSVGIVREKTMVLFLKNLVELGYMRSAGGGLIEMVKDVDKPYVFNNDNLLSNNIMKE